MTGGDVRPPGRRVVITGIGAITPVGSGAGGLWEGVRRGRPASRAITRFDPAPFRSRVAAEVDGFDPLCHMPPGSARRLDRFSQFSLAAGRQAVADSCGTLLATGDGAGIFLGSALGGIAFAEEQHEQYLRRGFHAVAPSLALSVFGGAGAGNLAIELGVTGPVIGNSNSCASGTIAVGEAFRAIRAGAITMAIAGGAECPLAPLTFGAFARIKAMTTNNGDPERACLPFDRRRDGFLMGEGAAMLVLEDMGQALRRNARIYAEVCGYGVTNDAHHMTAPLESGARGARAMTLALGDAGASPGEIGYVGAHAAGTPRGDVSEARAIRLALGEQAARALVSSTKGLHGHPLGASGAMETAVTAMALSEGWLPPTTNLDDPDPECDVRHVPAGGLACRVDTAIKNSFGFGGFNASLVLRRWNGA